MMAGERTLTGQQATYNTADTMPLRRLLRFESDPSPMIRGSIEL